MTNDRAQDKGKEIAFFDAHAERDEYDVFTPQAAHSTESPLATYFGPTGFHLPA